MPWMPRPLSTMRWPHPSIHWRFSGLLGNLRRSAGTRVQRIRLSRCSSSHRRCLRGTTPRHRIPSIDPIRRDSSHRALFVAGVWKVSQGNYGSTPGSGETWRFHLVDAAETARSYHGSRGGSGNESRRSYQQGRSLGAFGLAGLARPCRYREKVGRHLLSRRFSAWVTIVARGNMERSKSPMLIASYRSPKTVVRPSPIGGRGLFAAAPIRCGEVVCVKGGHLLDRQAMIEYGGTEGDAELQITDDLFLAPINADEFERVMMFLNHSCEPNVGIQGQIVFVAMRDVPAGEELTLDYATIDDDTPSFTCRCLSSECRGVVTGQDWQRPDLQKKYGRYFAWYLLEKMNG